MYINERWCARVGQYMHVWFLLRKCWCNFGNWASIHFKQQTSSVDSAGAIPSQALPTPSQASQCPKSLAAFRCFISWWLSMIKHPIKPRMNGTAKTWLKHLAMFVFEPVSLGNGNPYLVHNPAIKMGVAHPTSSSNQPSEAMTHISNASLKCRLDDCVRQWKPPGQLQFHVPARRVPHWIRNGRNLGVRRAPGGRCM